MSYSYNEGPLPFPDPLDRPGRTVLTAEGGTSPSRFKHVVETPSGRYPSPHASGTGATQRLPGRLD